MIKLPTTSGLWLISAASLFLTGCASMSTPQGGPRDETPPRLIKAYPAPGAINVDSRNIYLDFDEFITLKDAFTNVMVSPTSESQPRVSGVGKRVTVTFPDSLLSNTTYTIDFGNSIRDNNEGNALQGFSYSFSTGPTIDSLRISGIVLDSRTLEPQQGILVGVHTNAADSAFTHLRLERVARTDDYGRFSLRGLSDKEYHLFALNDLNSDLRWDNPEEHIAFYDFPIHPTALPVMLQDTIYNAASGIDSIREISSTTYLPNDILLSSFSLGYRPQYLKSYSRPDSARVVLVWNAPQPAFPSIKLTGSPQRSLQDWAVTEVRQGNDSITLWLTDKNIASLDTLTLSVQYTRNKSRQETEIATDTLSLIRKRLLPKRSSSAKKSSPTIPLLDITGGDQTQEYNLPYTFTLGTPPAVIDTSLVRLEQKIDTLWVRVERNSPILMAPDSLNPRTLAVNGPWQYGGQYRLLLDSLAVTDYFGVHNKQTELQFKVRKADEYSSLSLSISGMQPTAAFVELLDANDNILRTQTVNGGNATFAYLLPGTYYARVIYDLNSNGLYDTGDYDSRRQPEPVAYYPKKITLRKNWDQNLTWNVEDTPVDLQKPASAKKNKPKSTKQNKNRQKSEEDEEDEPFDPTANPFDPNSRRNRNNSGTRTSY